MRGRRNPFVAREALFACWATLRYAAPVLVALPAALVVVLYLVFRDPRRPIPSAPLGVVSPVDGDVVEVELSKKGILRGKGHRIVIRIDSMGTYTARSPVEGKILNVKTGPENSTEEYPKNSLWLQTDEGDDVALKFHGYRFGIPPKAFARYGERLGQGARCAYLRLTRYAEVHLALEAKVLVEPGQRLTAGSDLIARLPHP